MKNVLIIAEAGVNHNGSLTIAKRMVDAAVSAGADAVKFQTFVAESLVSRRAPKARYQKISTDRKETQFDMIRRLELDLRAHRELLSYCLKKHILFLSSPFDLDSIDLLSGLRLKIFKIPSGEINNPLYLKKIGSLRKKIILSTGMATLAEVKAALGILIRCGTKKGDITVLHCHTEYPTPFQHANLLAMLTIKKAFHVQVGYSDHTCGIEASIAAVALGARVIEKHFTLDRTMRGPDHQASLDPKGLKDLVVAVRNTEAALGTGIKSPSPCEKVNIAAVRKSVVAARRIKRGEFFDRTNLTVKRPGTGISPMRYHELLGKAAKKDFQKDELIKL
ncbi:MAG: N-acetylneuraminate synthase [Candidatus Omnitrophota bacterium]